MTIRLNKLESLQQEIVELRHKLDLPRPYWEKRETLEKIAAIQRQINGIETVRLLTNN
jgi:hypothetical protein